MGKKGKNGGHQHQCETRSKRGGTLLNKLRSFTYHSPPPVAHKPTYYTNRVFPSLDTLVASRRMDDSQEVLSGVQDFATLSIVQPIRVTKEGAVLRRGIDDEEEVDESELAAARKNSKVAKAHKLSVLKLVERALLEDDEEKEEEVGEVKDTGTGTTPLPLSALCVNALAKNLKECNDPNECVALGALLREGLKPTVTSLLSLYSSPLGYDTLTHNSIYALTNPDAKVLCFGNVRVRQMAALIADLRQAAISSEADDWETLDLPSSQTGIEVENIFTQLKGPHTLYLHDCTFATDADIAMFSDILGENLRHLSLMFFSTSPVNVNVQAPPPITTRTAEAQSAVAPKRALFPEHEKCVRVLTCLFLSSPAFSTLETLRIDYCAFGITLSGLKTFGSIVAENRSSLGSSGETLPALKALSVKSMCPLGDGIAVMKLISFFDTFLHIALTID